MAAMIWVSLECRLDPAIANDQPATARIATAKRMTKSFRRFMVYESFDCKIVSAKCKVQSAKCKMKTARLFNLHFAMTILHFAISGFSPHPSPLPGGEGAEHAPLGRR
jgi:hypothetical protein